MLAGMYILTERHLSLVRFIPSLIVAMVCKTPDNVHRPIFIHIYESPATHLVDVIGQAMLQMPARGQFRYFIDVLRENPGMLFVHLAYVTPGLIG
jgi:hypothetical protein